MRISKNGINLIKRFEGLRLKAYQCSAGVWTIGYGHTGGVMRGDMITQEEAESLLKIDLERFEDGVSNAVKVKITQSQFDAMVSLAFNIGVKAFANSTLVKKLNKSDYLGAQAQFQVWSKAGGKFNKGLLLRRMDEAELFLDGFSEKTDTRPTKKPDAPPLQKPLVQSRVILGSTAGATGGGLIAYSEIKDIREELRDTRTEVVDAKAVAKEKDYVNLAISIAIIFAACFAIYARISMSRKG